MAFIPLNKGTRKGQRLKLEDLRAWWEKSYMVGVLCRGKLSPLVLSFLCMLCGT